LQAELQQVAEALRQSTKQLCRNLKDNPNVAENMAKVWLRSRWFAASFKAKSTTIVVRHLAWVPQICCLQLNTDSIVTQTLLSVGSS
jgi:hypothetical protein